MPRNSKRILLGLVFSILFTLLLLGLLEVGFRRWQPVLDPIMESARPRHGARRCYRTSITLGYEPAPGQCGFNDQGFLAGDHQLGKPRDTYRILVLGDSLSEGMPWVGAMEQELMQGASGRRVEVWNGAVSGYDTCSELQRLQERGGQVNPDLVLVQFCANDFMISSALFPLPDGRVRIFAGHDSWDLPRWLLRSRLLTYLTIRYKLVEGWPAERSSAENVERCFERLKQVTAEQQVPLTVALFPVLSNNETDPSSDGYTAGDYRSFEREAGKMLTRLGIDTFFLRPGLQRAGGLESFRSQKRDLLHINIEGQRPLARLMVAHIREKYLGTATK